MAPMHWAQEQITHILDVSICLIVNEVYIDAAVRENVYFDCLFDDPKFISIFFSFLFFIYVNSSKSTSVLETNKLIKSKHGKSVK